MIRTINLILVHCSDSPHAHHDNYESIRKWHVDENGWSDVGYHYLILRSGELIVCRPIEIAGAHCRGYNKGSIAICLTGRDNFTKEQFKTLKIITDELKTNFGLNDYDILGHGELDKKKTCPNFNVSEEIRKAA